MPRVSARAGVNMYLKGVVSVARVNRGGLEALLRGGRQEVGAIPPHGLDVVESANDLVSFVLMPHDNILCRHGNAWQHMVSESLTLHSPLEH